MIVDENGRKRLVKPIFNEKKKMVCLDEYRPFELDLYYKVYFIGEELVNNGYIGERGGDFYILMYVNYIIDNLMVYVRNGNLTLQNLRLVVEEESKKFSIFGQVLDIDGVFNTFKELVKEYLCDG